MIGTCLRVERSSLHVAAAKKKKNTLVLKQKKTYDGDSHVEVYDNHNFEKNLFSG
jgi:hypothetical protein